MIRNIDHWSLHRTTPTIDDTESLSVLELVGKNTTKINEIITEINDAILFMKANLSKSIELLVHEMKENGELDDAILTALEHAKPYYSYNEESETLTFINIEEVIN